MKPKLLLFAHPSPASWVAHYIRAFRDCCELRAVGPVPGADQLAAWNRAGLADDVPRIDVPVALDANLDLAAALGDWTPDCAVGISGIGGDPLYPHTISLPCPTAFITVDTWQCLLDYPEARSYDFVFAAQREFVDPLRDTGARAVQWLPLACDPEAHVPGNASPTHDLAFAGSTTAPVHAERRRLLAVLGAQFSLYHQEHAFGADLSEAFARGRVTFNHSAVQELNMRIFEALAMGRPLLTNAAADYNGLRTLFADNEHMSIYEDERDLLERAQHLLRDDAARARMAAAGRAEVLAKHTYAHRAATVIETLRPWFGHSSERGDLLDWLPPAPGRVIDFGLGVRRSKIALRRRGVESFEGLATDMADADARRGSYDVILSSSGADTTPFDTAVLAATLPLAATLAEAHAVLTPGGTLLMQCAPDAPELPLEDGPLRAWLLAQGFHLRRYRVADGLLQIEGRRRTRPLRVIATELFTRLQVPGVEVPDLIPRIPAGW